MGAQEKKIPFAKKVKEEIASAEYTKEQKKWILSGFIRNGGVFSIGNTPSLVLKTELASTCKLIYSSLKEVYDLSPEIRYENVKRFARGLVYQVHCADKRLYDVMQDLEVLEDGFFRMTPKEGLHVKNLKYLVIGSFLANGSINNPATDKTSYFAEMAFTYKKDAFAVKHKLDSFKAEKTMNFKYIERRDKHVLYLKRSDQISVFLSYIGAMQAMFDFENARIMKDDMNVANRLNICDTANYSKTLSSATRDIEMIQDLLKVKPLSLYDQKTQAVIEARLKLKDSNYREIAEYVTKEKDIAISKSGVVHILSKLKNEYQELKKEDK